MKRKSFLLALVSILFFLSACALSPIEKYENFLADMDAETRIEVCLKQISERNPSLYTRGDVKTIQKDLKLLQTDDTEIAIINDSLITVVRTLEGCIKLIDSKDFEKAQADYEFAETLFRTAQAQLAQLRGGAPSV
ncbi:MAG: hypothetical protein VB082_08390 [Christensenella sp.]|nr:hypothetical protein [Christensenella sp.]